MCNAKDVLGRTEESKTNPTMNNLFFEFLQVAIGRRDLLSKVPTADEWGAIYGMSVKQSLVGVCFRGVLFHNHII